MIYSLQVERHVLSGLLKHQDLFADVDVFLGENDFFNDVHSTIYSVFKNIKHRGENVDKVLLAEKIKNLGISFKDEINIYDYIDNLSFSQITEQATMEACRELVKLRIRREISQTADRLKEYVVKNSDDSLDQIIGNIDQIYNKKISSYNENDVPINIFAEVEDLVEEIGNSPREDSGLITPYSEFNRMYGGLKNGNIYAIASRPGQGKALEENTPVLTTKGFKKIKDIKVGDYVFSIDGKPTKVLGTRKWKNRQLYKVSTDDNQFILADENHEWTVKIRNDSNWETLTTKHLFENKKSKRPKIPNYLPLQFEKQRLIINPYILGTWLGDGHSNSAVITSEDTFIINCWKNFSKKLSLKFKKYSKYSYRLYSDHKKNIFTQYLKYYNLINNKHIPKEYLESSISQRINLLQGLIDTDGYVANDGQVEFCNTNKKLAHDVLYLIHSLGIKASLYESDSYLYDKYCGKKYRIRFYYKNAAKLLRKAKKCLNSKKYNHRYLTFNKHGKGNTVCIQVDHPSHLFLAGKALIVTHNSTWLNDICFKTAINPKNKTKTLILDTEMQTVDIQLRMVASLTDVPVWYLETGNWRKNEEMTKKVRNAWAKVKQYEYFHYHVGNKNIDQICSIIRRWYLSKVGRGNQAMIAYDYIKLTGEKVGANWAEHQAIGDKIDKLKRISEEIHCPIITAMQLNRTGESFNRKGSEVVDDSSVISLSDRLQWFASFVAIFRRKTLDELTLDGQQFGTHKLIPTKTRFQGRDAAGHQDLVRRLDSCGKEVWAQNYLNYQVANFNIEERGSLRDVAERQREQYQLNDQNSNDGELL